LVDSSRACSVRSQSALTMRVGGSLRNSVTQKKLRPMQVFLGPLSVRFDPPHGRELL